MAIEISKGKDGAFHSVRIELGTQIIKGDFSDYLNLLKDIKNASVVDSRGNVIEGDNVYRKLIRNIFNT